MFKKEWLKDIKLINRPMTKVKVKVVSNVSDKNRILATEPGGSDKYIVNLHAIFPDQLPKLKALFADPKVTEVPIEETNGLFATASIFVNDPKNTPYLPMRGEEVFGNVDWVPNAEKTGQLLRFTNIQVLPPTQVDGLSLEELFAETSGEEVLAGEETASGRGEVTQESGKKGRKGNQ